MRSSVAVTDLGMVTVVDVFFGFAEPFLLDLFDFGMSRDTKGTCIRAFAYPLRNGYFRGFPVSRLTGLNPERKLGIPTLLAGLFFRLCSLSLLARHVASDLVNYAHELQREDVLGGWACA